MEIRGIMNRQQAESLFLREAALYGSEDGIPVWRAMQILNPVIVETIRITHGFRTCRIGRTAAPYLSREGFMLAVTRFNVIASGMIREAKEEPMVDKQVEIVDRINRQQAENLFLREAAMYGSEDGVPVWRAVQLLSPPVIRIVLNHYSGSGTCDIGGGYAVTYLTREGFMAAVSVFNVLMSTIAERKAACPHTDQSKGTSRHRTATPPEAAGGSQPSHNGPASSLILLPGAADGKQEGRA